ncbi:hypothetical protein [Paraburkholderia franconis]|uniref:hypothetical protein n=1 Tax=Paraburkholderia franconis TaxID=2654983 RepID=UPI00187B2C04
MEMNIAGPRKVECAKDSLAPIAGRSMPTGCMGFAVTRYPYGDGAYSRRVTSWLRSAEPREQRMSAVSDARNNAGRVRQADDDQIAIGQRDQVSMIEVRLMFRVLDKHERRKFVWAEHVCLLKGASRPLACISDL